MTFRITHIYIYEKAEVEAKAETELDNISLSTRI
jgi:hypothetical protein